MERANYSRTLFYKYYENINEVLPDYLKILTHEYNKAFINDSIGQSDYFEYCFDFVYSHKEFMVQLCNQNMHYTLLNIMNQNASYISDSPEWSFYVGGIYNVIIKWIENNFNPSSRELSCICKKAINPSILSDDVNKFHISFPK
ncbi:MAG: hypothetical protein PHH04_07135 [Thomasclavelia sp.]|nr:hypothetical protein [Thomasclavelia sp.]